jgi:hydrogenase nickel incorporation protein HypA/HybF
MHEFSLAQSVFDTVVTIAEERRLNKIKLVVLKFGVFALIQEDQFRFCFDLLKNDSNLTKSSELKIVWTPGELKCMNCNFEGKVTNNPQEHSELAPIFQCPDCESFHTEIISGTETIIDSLVA